MTVGSDEGRCVVCGTYETACPAVFRMGALKVAEARCDDCDDFMGRVLEAAEGRPQDAILVDEDQGARVVLTRAPPHNRGLADVG